METNQKLVPSNALWFVVLLLLTIPLLPAKHYNTPEIAIYPIIFGSYLGFMLILEITKIRLLKGLAIILYGVTYQVIYLNLVLFKILPEDAIPEEHKIQLDIFSQALLFACSGAGGSIIAVHADRDSIDNNPFIESDKLTNTNQDILPLTKSIENLNKKFKTLTNTLIATTLALLIFSIVLLIR